MRIPLLPAPRGARSFAALALAAAWSWAFAAPAFKVVDRIAIGGAPTWDGVFVDSARQRLYLAHGSQTDVIDTRTHQPIGRVPGTLGVKAIAIAADLGLGYTSNGKDDSVIVFDLQTLAPTARLRVGARPDQIVYEPLSQRVVVFNSHANSASVIDARSGTLVATVDVGGEPEGAAVGARGHIFFNTEDTRELVEFDPRSAAVVRRTMLKNCERPTGLTVNPAGQVFSICRNQAMLISSAEGKPIGMARTGSGTYGVAWLDGHAYSADGADGTISAIGADASGRFQAVGQIPSAPGARTIAADPATRRLYLPAAEFGPAAADGSRQALPGSLYVLVLEQQ
jgi:YVTN family beta-propeller protein